MVDIETNNERVKIELLGSREGEVTAIVSGLDDIQKLRELGVAGVLVGTLAGASQQNVFLGTPLRLMMEEALWVVEQGHGGMVWCEKKRFAEQITTVSEDMLVQWNYDEKKNTEMQMQAKRTAFLEKLRAHGVTENGSDDIQTVDAASLALMAQSVFVETPEVSKLRNRKQEMKELCNREHQMGLIRDILESDQKLRRNYKVYKNLREKGYFLSPGARFGGRFIAYPGDPLRYHSHLAIQNAIDAEDDDIDLIQLINGARLGTSVKKVWVLPGTSDDEENIDFFSVEWAGFG